MGDEYPLAPPWIAEMLKESPLIEASRKIETEARSDKPIHLFQSLDGYGEPEVVGGSITYSSCEIPCVVRDILVDTFS